ncbi:MAG: long-chain fatty acid--CoA ligase [Deltaproteobacteria bacterium]|nr:long-chain fatty acid--CoA ligase [Deltaproteobacteria bacterium]
MNIDRLVEVIQKHRNDEAIIYNDTVYLYEDLLGRVDLWKQHLKANEVTPGTVVSLIGDYSPEAVTLIIALILNRNIVVPLSPSSQTHFAEYFNIARVQYVMDLTKDSRSFEIRPEEPLRNDIFRDLIQSGRSGLILFTSGSSGRPKAVAHDFDRLLSKFLNATKRYRTLCFLMFDHIAGIDTYFYILYSGGTAVFPSSRQPGDICEAIERYRVEILPTSPTFLNLLLLSEAYKRYDLSSLEMITFGSERMPESLVPRLQEILSGVKLIQKYGITELGAPPSKTRPSDATWIKMDSDRFRTRVVDGVLQVKAETAMLGYLNASSPFTEDGWFNTGDSVEIDGDYIKILGRTSDIINVGGEKVYPADVENVIEEMENVKEATVFPEKNPLIGNLVCAKVTLFCDEDQNSFSMRLKKHCMKRLESYKVPVKIEIVNESQHTDRFKKIRKMNG